MGVRIADDAVEAAIAFLAGVMQGTEVSTGRGFDARISACTALIRFSQAEDRYLPTRPENRAPSVPRAFPDFAHLTDDELTAKVAQIVTFPRATTTRA